MRPLVLVAALAGCSAFVPRSLATPPGRSVAPLPMAPAELWTDYLGALETAPLVTKSLTAGVIIGTGDAVAQLIEGRIAADAAEPKKALDGVRTTRWALFGLVLQAPWNHFYYTLLDGAIPPTADPFTLTTAGKVCIDQFVQAPIFTAIIFVFFAVIEGRGLDAARKQLDEDLGQVLLKNWAVFIPATVINLAFCPPILRVLFLNVVFFFWVIFLSLTVNAADAGKKAA